MEKQVLVSSTITGTVLYNRYTYGVLAERCGIASAEWRILMYLAVCNRSKRRIRDLADFLFLNTSTVSDAATRLEQRGLVARGHRSTDLKAVDLSLTEAGADELNATAKAI